MKSFGRRKSAETTMTLGEVTMIPRTATLPAACALVLALGVATLIAAGPAAAEARSKEGGVLVLRGNASESEQTEQATKVGGVSVVRPDRTVRTPAKPKPLPYFSPAAAPGSEAVAGRRLWLVDQNREEVITCARGPAYYTGLRPII